MRNRECAFEVLFRLCCIGFSRAGLFPFRINVSSRSRSSPLSLTTYFFSKISFAAMIASLASAGDESESLNPFKLVEAGD
jgi:hypothetical protein